jgi:hypothetical protein
VNETERLLRALKKREIKVTPMGSDSTGSGGVRRAADDVGSTDVEGSGSDAGSGDGANKAYDGANKAYDDVRDGSEENDSFGFGGPDGNRPSFLFSV